MFFYTFPPIVNSCMRNEALFNASELQPLWKSEKWKCKTRWLFSPAIFLNEKRELERETIAAKFIGAWKPWAKQGGGGLREENLWLLLCIIIFKPPASLLWYHSFSSSFVRQIRCCIILLSRCQQFLSSPTSSFSPYFPLKTVWQLLWKKGKNNHDNGRRKGQQFSENRNLTWCPRRDA